MLSGPRTRWWPLALAGVLTACVPVTVNIHFSQEGLDSAAGRIEEMVRSPENPKPPAPPPGKPQSELKARRATPWLAAFAPREAAAQTTSVQVAQEPRVDSPEIQKAVASRSARLGALREGKARGCIGETNQGLVEARPGQGCGGEVSGLIGAENADRQVIISAFMRQNNIPASDTGRVRAAFAKANRDHAQPGEWVQQDNGQWVKK